ncbi:MAG: HNH endonuclease [Candidatus Saelkia tenebricola]|nr:HNH endonuclease [Candidatus Saelkia tenebricola]
MSEKRKIPDKVQLKIYERDNYLCQYCGKDGLESFDSWCFMTVDHFEPEGNNSENNLKTSCNFCNSIKSNKKFDSIDEVRAFVIRRKIEKTKEFIERKKIVK